MTAKQILTGIFYFTGTILIKTKPFSDIYPFYHSSDDTIDKVDMGFLAEVIRLVLATVLTVAGKQVGASLVFDPNPITSSGNVTLTSQSRAGYIPSSCVHAGIR